MSKVKDSLFTDQEPDEPMTPDPVYDEPQAPGGLIYTAMTNILSQVGSISKDQQNQQQRFKYRGIDDVYNSLHGLFAKNQVFCSAQILSRDREERTTPKGTVLAFVTLRMRYTFHASDGSSVSTEAVGEGMDAGDKATNKAMAIAHKYALLQAFLIPTQEEKDPDAETHTVTSGQWNREPMQNFQSPKPAPRKPPAQVSVAKHLNACETLQELQDMWKGLTSEQKQIYGKVKDICKDKILAKQADKDQELL